MSQLETRRLLLQPILPTDLDSLAAIWEDDEVMRYLPIGQSRTREAAQAQLDYMLSHWNQHRFGAWAIRRKGQAEMIGYCGLLYLHAEPGGVSEENARRFREVELMYGLSKACWGQGIGGEAAGEVLRYGFEELRLPRIVSAIHPDNLASRRILEKLGMKENPGLNFYGDCPHFSLTNEEYQAR